MRKLTLIYLPALVAMAAVPAAAQVSGHVRIDIPIGRPAVIHGVPHRELLVRGYDPYLFGDWEDYYDDWSPITVYLYDGHYYDYPIVSWAQPIVVYSYRNQLFFPPRDQGFVNWRRERVVAPVARPRSRLVEPGGYNRGYGRVERQPARVTSDRRSADLNRRSVAAPSRTGGRPQGGRPQSGGSRGGSRGGSPHGGGSRGHGGRGS